LAALCLTLAFAVTAFADDPGFPAPTGDPTFVLGRLNRCQNFLRYVAPC